MNKLIATSFCLLLAASPFAAAQNKGIASKPPMTGKELAEKNKAVNKQTAECTNNAQRQQLKQGSKEFVNFMTQCVNQKK